ncbi:DDE Tnp4 domain-containing protein [Citrus sinensis]|nr:DDE Tnp4 domain-containing protein [Citrus sinensis]
MIHSRTFQFHATRQQYLDSIIGNSDIQCVNQLRMDRRTFGLLCELLRSRGLKASGSLALEEQVCMFLHTLSHHVKNRTIGIRFFRFGETVSRYFNSVLNKVLQLHNVLLRVPGPVPNNYADEKWKWFKNCLGALDGTYIRLCVPENDKPRYRTRKGEIATNVLRVCSQDMKFIFVMPGWEGSASN